MIFLETSRLLFRTHEPEDEADFIKMHTDPEVRRYVGGSPWPVEKAVHRFRNQYLGHPTKTYGLWATIYKGDGKYIGACGLTDKRADKAPGLGYYIARPYRGQGLASEASKAFIELGFTRLQSDRLVADVQEGNKPSEHILRKFGFQYHSREELPNGRIIVLYELLKADWEKTQA
jgi:ribosomal-protein-alanine N-acetyltransferase